MAVQREKMIPLAFFGSKLRTCKPSNVVARDRATYACPGRERSLQLLRHELANRTNPFRILCQDLP